MFRGDDERTNERVRWTSRYATAAGYVKISTRRRACQSLCLFPASPSRPRGAPISSMEGKEEPQSAHRTIPSRPSSIVPPPGTRRQWEVRGKARGRRGGSHWGSDPLPSYEDPPEQERKRRRRDEESNDVPPRNATPAAPARTTATRDRRDLSAHELLEHLGHFLPRGVVSDVQGRGAGGGIWSSLRQEILQRDGTGSTSNSRIVMAESRESRCCTLLQG